MSPGQSRNIIWRGRSDRLSVVCCILPLMHGASQEAAAGGRPTSLAGEGLQGAMQQARLESDSSVVEIRNNAILQAELQSSRPYK